MRTVTLGVPSLEEAMRRAEAASRGAPRGAFIAFASVDLLRKVLIPRRWDLLNAMAGQGPMTIREAARRVGRDVKAVRGSARALLAASVLERTGGRQIVFPCETVHVKFVLQPDGISARAQFERGFRSGEACKEDCRFGSDGNTSR
jgi:predicted transcriptional regulator